MILGDLSFMYSILKETVPEICVFIEICFDSHADPWLIMVEFASEGTLYQYLQHRRPGDLRVQINAEGRDSVSLKNQNLTPHKLLSLAAQVVTGIEHLNKFKVSTTCCRSYF